jgi:hypothetical protein
MMNSTDPALAHFSGLLQETVNAGNTSRLKGFLSGRELPALGGDQEPSDIVRRAILEAEEPSTFVRHLSYLLASVVSAETERLSANALLDARRRDLLVNVFHLAIDLPAEENLFAALRGLHEELVSEDLEIPLCQALSYQQVDSSLEEEWISILQPSEDEVWTPARRTLLLTAWRGLLWIPPDPKTQEAGEIIDFDRIELGLIALHNSVEGHEEARALLGTALHILAETYPRSAEFWRRHLQPRAMRWPIQLQESFTARWPAESAEIASDESAWVLELVRLNEQFDRLTSEAVELGRQIEQARSLPLEDPLAEMQRRLRQIDDFIRQMDRLRQGEVDTLIRSVRKAG